MKTPKIVVITGATGGLGSALVRLHLDKGDTVIATGRTHERLNQLAEQLGNPPALACYPVNVADTESCRELADWVKNTFGGCSVLYNNAGYARFAPFAEMSLVDIRQTVDANLAGLLYLTHSFLPMMIAAKTGHIVNIASLAGHVATAKAAVYAGSKAAVIRFSEGLRHELAQTGVHVTCVMPGPIDTPFLDHADQTGAYRGRVRRYLLTPEATARRILRAVERRQDELAMPRRLHLLSLLYLLLPGSWKRLFAPLLNRK